MRIIEFVLAIPVDRVDWSILSASHNWFELPIPFKFGFFSLDLHSILMHAFLFLVTVIEAIGDLTATSAVSEQPTEGEVFKSASPAESCATV